MSFGTAEQIILVYHDEEFASAVQVFFGVNTDRSIPLDLTVRAIYDMIRRQKPRGNEPAMLQQQD